MTATPTLSAAGIVLRPLLASDAPALFIALSDPAIQRYRLQDAHESIAETSAYIADTLAKSRAAWAITEAGGEALGRLALRTPEPDVGEFGIVIRAAAHRRGLGLKALTLAEAFAFGELRLQTLRAGIDAKNTASLALFARAGFTAQPAINPGAGDSIVMAKRRPTD